MKASLNKIKRILFIIPLLAISLWAFGFGQNQSDEFILNDYSFLLDNKEHKQTQYSSVNFEENEVVLIEIEPESEVEIESFHLNDFSFFLLFLKQNKVQNYLERPRISINKSIPLYDLFCNWKFQLS